MKPADLHVISVISNPVRYKTRTNLFTDFLKRMAHSGATHWIVEAVFGERHPTVLDPHNPQHIKVRCDDELWLKENLINVAARHLPDDAKYVMWLDGDVHFERDDWAMETLHALQHYDAVQPFSHAVDYGPDHEILQTATGFAYCYVSGQRVNSHKYGGPYWHPGYAWAFRMETWQALGGMIERAICGSADHHMACSLVGRGLDSFHKQAHPNYRRMIEAWQARAETSVRRNIGYVPGTLLHYYHGAKANRKYVERWDILTKNDFDPYADVFHDRHGVLRLAPAIDHRTRTLRDQLRTYFRQRKEDDRA